MRAPMSPRASRGPPAWLKAVVPGMVALAVLAPGGWGEGPHCVLPCLHLSAGTLGHVTGTSSKTLQMNFLIYRHYKKKPKQKIKQNP